MYKSKPFLDIHPVRRWVGTCPKVDFATKDLQKYGVVCTGSCIKLCHAFGADRRVNLSLHTCGKVKLVATNIQGYRNPPPTLHPPQAGKTLAGHVSLGRKPLMLKESALYEQVSRLEGWVCQPQDLTNNVFFWAAARNFSETLHT